MIGDERFTDGGPAEAEWQAQERALRLERANGPGNTGAPRERQYRLLARVLAEPARETLAFDFAAMVARQARALDAAAEERDRQFESRLLIAIAAFMVVSFAAIGVAYGEEILLAAQSTGPGLFALTPWTLAMLGCVGLTFVAQRLRIPRH
jgi:hypothetical protein